MTHRERFVRTMMYKPVDRVPDYEFGAWNQTITRWHNEGLPLEFTGERAAVKEYCNTETIVDMGLITRMLPGYECKVLEEKGNHIIIQNDEGAICEMLRPELGASVPKYLKFAIENKKDWEKIRDERLNPNDSKRIPANIEKICKDSWISEDPISVDAGSIYGWLRNWMGVENLSCAIYDDPEWIEEMMEHLTCLTLTVLEKIAGKAKVDQGEWWEDMCFKSGPLLSPEYVNKWMVPRYKRVTDFLRNECSCKFNVLDCDGNIHKLVPLWYEGGINIMWPLEAAHTDAYKISEQFGKRMGLRGYFNKIALIYGKEAIDREFERIRPLFERGGYIPHLDHLVPPDVSFENFQYYMRKKHEFIGKRIPE